MTENENPAGETMKHVREAAKNGSTERKHT
jgi:hypothetical protein